MEASASSKPNADRRERMQQVMAKYVGKSMDLDPTEEMLTDMITTHQRHLSKDDVDGPIRESTVLAQACWMRNATPRRCRGDGGGFRKKPGVNTGNDEGDGGDCAINRTGPNKAGGSEQGATKPRQVEVVRRGGSKANSNLMFGIKRRGIVCCYWISKHAVQGELNDLIEKAEDPEKLLKQLVLDMENQLMQVKTQVAIAIADQHVLDKKRKEHEDAAAEWKRKAELAVKKSADDLARGALERSRVRISWQRDLPRRPRIKSTRRKNRGRHCTKLEQKLTGDARTL